MQFLPGCSFYHEGLQLLKTLLCLCHQRFLIVRLFAS